MQKEIFFVKHSDLIKQMTLEEKCYLLSGKDFWQTRSVERLGVRNMVLSDGPHGVRRQAGSGDQLGLNPFLPAYSQALFVRIGVPQGLAPTLANIVNILMQVAISYPTMKFWVMPDNK